MSKTTYDFVDQEVRIRMLELLSAKVDRHLTWATVIFGGLMTAVIIPVVLYALHIN